MEEEVLSYIVPNLVSFNVLQGVSVPPDLSEMPDSLEMAATRQIRR